MERLTEWDEFGNADIITLSDMMPEIYAGLSFGETNALTDALNRLAAYEDTEMTPEEIVNFVSQWKDAAEFAGLCKQHGDHLKEFVQAESEGRLLLLPEANDPLTLEQLREMDGEPVWIEPVPLTYKGHWEICNCEKYNLQAYGVTWLAYRRRPEGV